MSRELDEKVARVLVPNLTSEAFKEAVKQDGAAFAYSSDWLCFEEMLAWLRNLGSVQIDVGIWRDAEVSASFCSRSTPDIDDCAVGATLPEALARLVVAVAEAKEAGK